MAIKVFCDHNLTGCFVFYSLKPVISKFNNKKKTRTSIMEKCAVSPCLTPQCYYALYSLIKIYRYFEKVFASSVG